MNDSLEKEYKALKWEVVKAMISLLGVFFAPTLLLGEQRSVAYGYWW